MVSTTSFHGFWMAPLQEIICCFWGVRALGGDGGGGGKLFAVTVPSYALEAY